jgi:hypothetical protein
MSKRRKIKVGDVFRFGTGSNRWGFGQVLMSDILQFIVVFEPMFPDNVDVGLVLKSPLLLAGWTSDALFWHQRWEVVENRPALKFRFPEYKVEMEGRTWLTDVEGHMIRLASVTEEHELMHKFSSSPISFQKAFMAHHGLLSWESFFEDLLLKRNTGG